MRKTVRKTDLTVDEIMFVIQSGKDNKPICYWVSELAVRAVEDGDPKSELALRNFLKRGGENEKCAAYWGLRDMKKKTTATVVILENFEKVPQNERFMVPPRPQR